jgi:hypothetical protein
MLVMLQLRLRSAVRLDGYCAAWHVGYDMLL